MNTLPKIMLGMAGPDLNVMLREFTSVLIDDPRFTTSMQPNTWELLTMLMARGEPDVLLVYADIAPSPEELAAFLGNLKRCIVLVLLPANWAATQGLFENLAPVKKTYILPVLPMDVIRDAESLFRTAQAISTATSPFHPAAGGSPSEAYSMGTKFVSFVSAEGGTGRTTLAANLAYELGVRRSIHTLLCSFDWPSKVPLHFHMNDAPNAGEFFARPGRPGFDDSLQKFKGNEALQVLLAPQDMVAYSQAEQRSQAALQTTASAQDSATSIRALLLSAYSKMCAAVILDLPPAMPNNVWTWHSLAVSNFVLVVARPTLDGIKTVGTMMRVLTQMLASEHQFQRSSIFLILNQRSARSPFTPVSFSKEVAEAYGWCPPVIASFDHQEEIVTAQNNQRPAVETCEPFSRGIIALARSFWPASSAEAVRPKGRKLFGVLEVVPDSNKR